MAHSFENKTPIWVIEHLTAAKANGSIARYNKFLPDPDLNEGARAELEDYKKSGYDRGHMAPAGNNTQNDVIMSESFNLSNMVPQVANNNRGIWKQLETFERQWATAPGTDFYIISGGIYDQGHPVVGNGLGIPTRLYKIIIEKNSKKVQAYLMPNTALPVQDLPKYQVPMAAIEQATGIKFNLGP